MPVPLADTISSHRLRWLGHLGGICDSRLPIQMLFGWLSQSCPAHGVKLHWRDRLIKHLHISESDWYVVAQGKDQWSQLCMPSPSLSEPAHAAAVVYVTSETDILECLRIWQNAGIIHTKT